MKLEQSDSRGFIISFKVEDREYLLIYTRKNYMRGGETHKGKEVNVLIEGEALWYEGQGEYNKTIIIGPETITIPPNIPHMMYALTDTLIIECKEGLSDYFRPFRERVEYHNTTMGMRE